jgi:hypothetical protein
VTVVVTIALGGTSSSALAGPRAASDSIVNGTSVHQEINVFPDAIHYWYLASNPAGVAPFCVTLQLERKRPSTGWQGIGLDGRRGSTGCCPNPDDECFDGPTIGFWDLFIYPGKQLRRKVRDGRLRIHGFSDFGPSITLRLGGRGG